MEKEAKLQSRVTVICMLSLPWVLAGKLSRPRLSEAPSAKGTAEQPRPKLQLPGCPARRRNPRCADAQILEPDSLPFADSGPRSTAEPRAVRTDAKSQDREHFTESTGCIPAPRSHSFPQSPSGNPHPGLRPPGGRLRGLVRVAAGQFLPAPLPPNPPAPTETCCCAGAAIRKRAPRPSSGQSPARLRERGRTRGFRERGAAPCKPGLHGPRSGGSRAARQRDPRALAAASRVPGRAFILRPGGRDGRAAPAARPPATVTPGSSDPGPSRPGPP